MMSSKTSWIVDLGLSLGVLFVLLAIQLTFDITGNSGDSNLHFLYSFYAPQHPELFFNHWAKPFFVLVSSPFAQFGFEGIIFFNSLVLACTSFLTLQLAQSLGLRNRWISIVFAISAPLYFRLVFSGLTEYLFALLLIAGVLLSSKNRLITAAIIISFLPFVRSEGLLIIAVFGVWFALNRAYKAMAFLLLGNVIYAFAGFFIYEDLLWAFTKVPYAKLTSTYGQGDWFDFIHRLAYVIEKPNYLLLLVGFIMLVMNAIRGRFVEVLKNPLTLVWGSFLVYFVSHSIFWALGIFNSMGLPRVLNAVVPCIVIIQLYGIDEALKHIQKSPVRKGLLGFTALLCLLYPFTNRPQGVEIGKSMFRVPSNELFDELASRNIETFSESTLLVYNDPYISVAQDIDHFEPSIHKQFEEVTLGNLPSGTLVIWDSWFAKVEGATLKEDIADQMEYIDSISNDDWEYSLFVVP